MFAKGGAGDEGVFVLWIRAEIGSLSLMIQLICKICSAEGSTFSLGGFFGRYAFWVRWGGLVASVGDRLVRSLGSGRDGIGSFLG